MPAGLHRAIDAGRRSLPDFDPNAIDEDAPQHVIDKLMRIPYFRQAYEIDGMRPEEFSHFGAFVATASEFAGATRRTVDFVAQAIEKTKLRAA